MIQLLDKRTAKKMLFGLRFNEERDKWLEELRRTQTVERFTYRDLIP